MFNDISSCSERLTIAVSACCNASLEKSRDDRNVVTCSDNVTVLELSNTTS